MKKAVLFIVVTTLILWANTAFSYETLNGGSQSFISKLEVLFQLFFFTVASLLLSVFSGSLLANAYSSSLRYKYLTEEKKRVENEINKLSQNCISFLDPHINICADASKMEGDTRNTESRLRKSKSRLNNGGAKNE